MSVVPTLNAFTPGTTGNAVPVQENFDDVRTFINDELVSVSGATMTGQLILSGPPTSGLSAATKDYVDNATTTSTGGSLVEPFGAGLGGVIHYTLIGGLVFVMGHDLPSTVATSTSALPAGYRPATDLDVGGYAEGSGDVEVGALSTGFITVATATGALSFFYFFPQGGPPA